MNVMTKTSRDRQAGDWTMTS